MTFWNHVLNSNMNMMNTIFLLAFATNQSLYDKRILAKKKIVKHFPMPFQLKISPCLFFQIRLYRDSNYYGGYQEYTASASSFPGFNDETSSIKVFGGRLV